VGANNGYICSADGREAGVVRCITNNAGVGVRWRCDRKESGANGDMGEQVVNGIGNHWYRHWEKAGGGGTADITTCDNAERAKRDGEPERNTCEANIAVVVNECQKVKRFMVQLCVSMWYIILETFQIIVYCIDTVCGVGDAERRRERCKCLISNFNIKSIK
jgi:hypothetical protein